MSLHTTPWTRTAIERNVPGGLAGLARRVPYGTRLMFGADRPSGPYRVSAHNGRITTYDRLARADELAARIDEALEQVWP